ncbi:hypothetical protein PG996_001628 [Apiospora saccharicola]|uniref:Uncharacterized protein n=1 Tax=Apiospora saccharicola TaxID=335842 RepID=A0ABR1WH88_9PEZI
MYHCIIALAVTASSIPYAAAQIATQFQAPSIAFAGDNDCSNSGTASTMVAGACTAIPADLLSGMPSQSMNVTYPIDNVDLNCPRTFTPASVAVGSALRISCIIQWTMTYFGDCLVTFYADALCAEVADRMPYAGAEECLSVGAYGSVMAKCSNILTGATYTAPASSN